jgi:hypothetical protein
MDRGLLWYDDDPDRSLIEKVRRATQRYSKKFGAPPDACYVHPSVLKDNGRVKEVGGVRVMALPSVLRHHFWLGREEKRRRRKAAR